MGAVSKIMIFLILAGSIVLTLFVLLQQTTLNSRTTTSDIKLQAVVSQPDFPKTVTIFLTSPKKETVVFVKAIIKFNPDQLALTKNPTPSKIYNQIIKLTSAEEANTTGEIVAILGMDPTLPPAERSSKSQELLKLKFDDDGKEFLPPAGSLITLGGGDSYTLTLAGINDPLPETDFRITSDRMKTREIADLGLKLKITTDSQNQPVLTANWNQVSSPAFEFSVITLRNASTQKLVPDSRSEQLTTNTYIIPNASSLASGQYIVRLRQSFNRKIVIQDPQVTFTVTSSHTITRP